MNVKVADTWVTIPEISLEREDEDMKIEVGKVYESQEERNGIATGDLVCVQNARRDYVSFRKDGDPVHFRWALEVFKDVFYPYEQNDEKASIQAGKTYRVLKDYKNRGNYRKGDLLEITYIDKNEEYNRVDFLYNGTKSEFDSLEWIEKMELEEVKTTSKPAHYDTAIDTIAFAKANFTPEQVEGFMRINAIKYLQRNKGEKLSDLKKCLSYVKMLIEMEEAGNDD